MVDQLVRSCWHDFEHQPNIFEHNNKKNSKKHKSDNDYLLLYDKCACIAKSFWITIVNLFIIERK